MARVFHVRNAYAHRTADYTAGQSNRIVIGIDPRQTLCLYIKAVYGAGNFGNQSRRIACKIVHRNTADDACAAVSTCACRHAAFAHINFCPSQCCHINIMSVDSLYILAAVKLRHSFAAHIVSVAGACTAHACVNGSTNSQANNMRADVRIVKSTDSNICLRQIFGSCINAGVVHFCRSFAVNRVQHDSRIYGHACIIAHRHASRNADIAQHMLCVCIDHKAFFRHSRVLQLMLMLVLAVILRFFSDPMLRKLHAVASAKSIDRAVLHNSLRIAFDNIRHNRLAEGNACAASTHAHADAAAIVFQRFLAICQNCQRTLRVYGGAVNSSERIISNFVIGHIRSVSDTCVACACPHA